ncbi:MAG TPA: histidine phosphatase family protein [Polyangiaceae bacterium]|nr:histidine phosphatase family protein [Polyangiaceae bacterium]
MTVRRIFLARHGNRQDRVHPGWAETAVERHDPPLSIDGFEQARALGRRLASEDVTAIVASPFLRTVQTAIAVNETLGVPLHLEPGFGEWLSVDSFERLPRLRPFAELKALHPQLNDRQACGQLTWPETREQLQARVQAALFRWIRQIEGTLLLISHASPIGAAVLLDGSLSRVECSLCALFCLEHDAGRFRLVVSGDVAHVGARLATFVFPP